MIFQWFLVQGVSSSLHVAIFKNLDNLAKHVIFVENLEAS